MILVSVLRATGAEAATSYAMEPLWSAVPTEQSAYLFGTIEDVAVGSDGTVYVLDSQLDDIKVFAEDGAYLRTMGRPGDGPGDLRASGRIFLLADDRLGVVSKMGGRITILDAATGEERDRWNPAGLHSTVVMLSRTLASYHDGRPLIVVVLGEQVGSSFSQRLSLATYELENGADWNPPRGIIADIGLHDADGFEEEYYYLLWNPWTIDTSHRIVMAPYWSRYELWYLDLEGNHLRTVARPTPVRDRTEIEKRRLLDYVWGGIDPGPVIGVELRLARHEAAVREIWPRPGGGIWVRTCDAGRGDERGVFLQLDEFDVHGVYRGTVEIRGPGDESLDRVYFGPDGRMVVVHDAEGFIHTHRGRDPGSVDYELVVAAYELVRQP